MYNRTNTGNMILDDDKTIIEDTKGKTPVTANLLMRLGFTNLGISNKYSPGHTVFYLENEEYGQVVLTEFNAKDNQVVAKHLPEYDHCYSYNSNNNQTPIGFTCYNYKQLVELLKTLKEIKIIEKETTYKLNILRTHLSKLSI